MSTELDGHSRPRRVVDNSNRDARRAVAEVIGRFLPWRQAIAEMNGQCGTGRLTQDAREKLIAECADIQRGIGEARTDLILELADAPSAVTGNSRVVDVERALDNLESTLADLRQQLERAH